MGGDCYPLVNGCVSKASRELLYSCISELPVDTVISSKGKLRVDAEIPGNVDECPYHGNLLHGVTTVRCHVGKLADLTTTTSTTTTTTVAKIKSAAAAYAASAPTDFNFVKKWLEEHPGKSLTDMPGYSSFYNLSQLSEPAEPASFGSGQYGYYYGYYGSSDSTHLQTQLGSSGTGGAGGAGGAGGSGGAGGAGGSGAGGTVTGGTGGVVGSAAAASGLLGQARPFFPFRRPTSLTTQGALRCAEKGCSTSLVLDFNRTLAQINRRIESF